LIADRSSGVVVKSTMGGESYQAGIDDEDMAHIIGLFTDLYSDTELACLREYSTNARDAMIEAGVSGPIEVTLPNALSSFLTIKDRGIGLDEETIRKVYSRYGKSTKRASNDFNGMLGLGCKSALTYAQNFTVESVKDGVKTLCSITRVDNGVPSFQVVATSETDEPNGTTVRIPARRYNDFEKKAKGLYRFWPKGTVLVNGVEPDRFDGLDLGERKVTVKWATFEMDVNVRLTVAGREEGLHTNLIVMGGVAYPAPSLKTGLGYNRRVVADVSIGAVDFTPSREALMTTPKTEATLEAIGTDVRAAAAEAVQKLIEAASSPREALQIYYKNRDLAPSAKDLQFGGKDLPETLDGEFILTASDSYRLGRSERYKGLSMEIAVNAMFVTEFAPQTFSAPHKKRLLKYCEDNGHDVPKCFVLTRDKSVDLSWLGGAHVAQWEDVRKVKLPRAQSTRSGKPLGSYDVLVNGSLRHVKGEDIDVDEVNLFHMEGSRWEVDRYSDVLRSSYPEDLYVVVLPSNRVAKYERLFPESEKAEEKVKELYDAWKDSITEEELLGLTIDDEGYLEVFSGLKGLPIDDPEIQASIKAAQVDLTAVKKSRNLFRTIHGYLSTGVRWDNPLEKYSLLTDRYGAIGVNPSDPHLVIYLNAAYAADNA
jgi:hypothetical protein